MTDAVDLIVEQWRKERPDLVDALRTAEVLGRVQRMQSVLDRHFKKLNDAFGLGSGEFDLLSALRRSGPPYMLTAGAFLRVAMVTSGAITNRIDRMEARGLVERVRDSADRRSVKIRLTERGVALADEAIEAHLRDNEAILSALAPDECEQLAAALRKVLEAQGDTALR